LERVSLDQFREVPIFRVGVDCIRQHLAESRAPIEMGLLQNGEFALWIPQVGSSQKQVALPGVDVLDQLGLHPHSVLHHPFTGTTGSFETSLVATEQLLAAPG
jgi:hypothetical protein